MRGPRPCARAATMRSRSFSREPRTRPSTPATFVARGVPCAWPELPRARMNCAAAPRREQVSRDVGRRFSEYAIGQTGSAKVGLCSEGSRALLQRSRSEYMHATAGAVRCRIIATRMSHQQMPVGAGRSRALSELSVGARQRSDTERASRCQLPSRASFASVLTASSA